MKTVTFIGIKCNVVKHEYENGRIALQLVAAETSDLAGEGEAVCRASVNVPEAEIAEGMTLIKDYSENAGILKALKDARIVADTGMVVACGYCKANLVKVLI